MPNATELLEEFFAAINRNDIEAASRYFHPQVVRIEPEGFPTAGTYRGVTEVSAHLARGRGTWAEGTCDPERYFVNGEKAVVFLHARVRVKDASEWIDGRFADGFVLRDGKILEYNSFAERGEALAWAGIENDPAT